MTSLLLALVISTTPPLVPSEEPGKQVVEQPRIDELPAPPPPPVLVPRRTRPELKPARLALWFAPMSLFGLMLSVEAEVHLTSGLSIFLNGGGGALGQLVADLGARYGIEGKAFQGFYLDVRGSLFSLPGSGLVMLGPGMQIGHSWRTPILAISIALGFTTWIGVARANAGALFLGNPITDDQVMLLPGITQPPAGQPAVQPALRFSFGPAF
ncbi:MAG: hypothetical protein JNM17_31335 [Archangium sp.]|nr:hypothetical protein [Archangium sp.]